MVVTVRRPTNVGAVIYSKAMTMGKARRMSPRDVLEISLKLYTQRHKLSKNKPLFFEQYADTIRPANVDKKTYNEAIAKGMSLEPTQHARNVVEEALYLFTKVYDPEKQRKRKPPQRQRRK